MPAIKDYWPLVLESIKQDISGSSFQAWFSTLNFVSTKNHGRKLVLSVPSDFNKKYLQTKFRSQLQEAINKYYPQVIHIDFEVIEILKEEQIAQESVFNQNPNQNNTQTFEPIKLVNVLPKSSLNNLNPKYTFENFVTTKHNELAVSVAKSIIQQPGTLYNPVFLYSGVGLGKTHLLQAIGHKTLELNPSFNIKYVTSETFVNHYIDAIQKRQNKEFKEYYRSVDLLLIDDIQFISGKESTQEAFFHTFNELHQLNKQIVITCDKHPKSLDGVENRLVSRFEWGIVIDITRPDLEDRQAVIQDKVERMKLNLQKDQIVRIAQTVETNFRDIEGVLNRIQARQQLIPNKPVENYELEKILAGASYSSPIRIAIGYLPNTPERIIDITAQVFAISKEELLGQKREKNLVIARQIAMYLCKEDLEYSFPVIGKLFHRDHTTIMHGCKKIATQVQIDEKLKSKLDIIRQLYLKN